MNSRKLIRGTEAPNVPGVGPVPWGDIDRYIREGRRLHAEALAGGFSAAARWVKRAVARIRAERGAETRSAPAGFPTWDDVERHIQQGRRVRAETLAAAFFGATRLLNEWLGGEAAERRAQARAERAASRLRDPEASAEVTRGFFWPRLSWVAREGARWFGFGAAPEEKEDGQQAA